MVQQELLDRLDIIQRMMEEGRNNTSYWGWTFVLWGLGHAGAAVWSIFTPRPWLPWAVLMTLCGIISGVGSSYMHRAQGRVTTAGRAMAGIWGSLGMSLFLLGVFGGRYQPVAGRLLVAVFCTFLAMANSASGHLFRWTPQRANGIFLWLCAVAAFLAPDNTALFWSFMASVLVGEVGFGMYLMARERSDRLKRALVA